MLINSRISKMVSLSLQLNSIPREDRGSTPTVPFLRLLFLCSVDSLLKHSLAKNERRIRCAKKKKNTVLASDHSRPKSSTVWFASRLVCVSCSSGNGKKLNFLIGRLKINEQQGTTIYNAFIPVEFQMLGRVYKPVEICPLHQQFQRFNAISRWLEAKL